MSGMMLGILVFFPFLGALLCFVAGRKSEILRDYTADAVTVLEFALMLMLFAWKAGAAGGTAGAVCTLELKELCGLGLSLEADGFRLLYGLIAALMWMMTTILSRQYCRGHRNTTRFYVFMLLTLGATMGVFLSADLFTTFVFFELMSFTSYVWVAQEENAPSLRAAETYLAVAVAGGMVMLMGLFLLYHALGTTKVSELQALAAVFPDRGLLYAAGGCMLVGFGAKAGAFPLHIWLPKAHPVAPAPASALLSGILTKTGIYGTLILTAQLFWQDAAWGRLILVIGVLTMFGGALLAVFSIDLKRTLACSSMSQIGFILVGIGMQGLLGAENALAVHGTLLHMVNHSLIKLVLFMAAGVIYMNVHALDLNEIRGFGRKKQLLKVIFAVGALAIAGVPAFGGYISKTLLHESIVEYGGGAVMKAVEWMFLISGGLTAAYMAKLFAAVFVEKNEDPEVQKRFDRPDSYMNAESTFALAGSAALLLIWGLFPHQLMDRAAALGEGFLNLSETGEMVAYFSIKNLSGALISLAVGAAVYLVVIRRFLMEKTARGGLRYVNRWPAWLDLEELVYRPLLRVLSLLCGIVCRAADSLIDLLVVALRKSVYRDSPLPHELTEGNVVTLAAGRICNGIQRGIHRLFPRREKSERDFVHYFAVKYEELRENNTVIGRSLSFALFLLCIGFCLTLFYLIWW